MESDVLKNETGIVSELFPNEKRGESSESARNQILEKNEIGVETKHHKL